MLCLSWSTGAQLMPRGMRDPGSLTRDQTRVPYIGRLIPPGKSLARLLNKSPAPPPFGQNPHEHLWVKQWGRCSAHLLVLPAPPSSDQAFPLPHAGLVSERPGQVQAQPLTAGKHGRGQVDGGGAADRDSVRAGLGAVQRLAQPLQHAHHPHRLD